MTRFFLFMLNILFKAILFVVNIGYKVDLFILFILKFVVTLIIPLLCLVFFSSHLSLPRAYLESIHKPVCKLILPYISITYIVKILNIY